MKILRLFLAFLEVGAVSFGGGFGMISMIREKVLSNGWLTEDELLNMIAVSESTPGPIAVNIATFVGASEGGVLGAIAATLGVVLPSFIIILVISSLVQNLFKYAGVKAFLGGIRPCIVALILATALTLFLNTALGITAIKDGFNIDVRALVIFAILILSAFILKKLTSKKPSPIVMILISAGLGMVMYSI